jgi:hypothetical protein
MALEAYSVDFRAPGLDELDDAEGASVFFGAVLEVVILESRELV